MSSTDASSYDLGVVLLQQHEDGKLHPVDYASRSMLETETWYTQIEKEAFAITWGCEQFSDYLIGLEFTIKMHYKPLIPLLGNKDKQITS